MIRGAFQYERGYFRPFLDVEIAFSDQDRRFAVSLLLDTGADRTLLSPRDSLRLFTELNIDVREFPAGNPSLGVGGSTATFELNAALAIQSLNLPLTLTALDPAQASLRIPSVVGRDVLSQFALYLEENHGLVLLLEPHEADSVRPYLP